MVPGWYPDPSQLPHTDRWWDGGQWTTALRGSDAPLVAPAKISARKAIGFLAVLTLLAVVVGVVVSGGGPSSSGSDYAFSGLPDAGYVVARRTDSGWGCREGGLRLECAIGRFELSDQLAVEPGNTEEGSMLQRFRPFTGMVVRYDPSAWSCEQPSETRMVCTAD